MAYQLGGLPNSVMWKASFQCQFREAVYSMWVDRAIYKFYYRDYIIKPSNKFIWKNRTLTQDRPLACIYGGILVGVGMAIVLKGNGSTGGTDLLTYIIRRYRPHFKSSSLIVIIDVIIVILNVFFFKEIEIGLVQQ